MLMRLNGQEIQDEDRRHSLDAGFDQRLVKPVAPEHLDSVIAPYRGKGVRADGRKIPTA